MELLTCKQMEYADRLTFAAGATEFSLISEAADAVAQHCLSVLSPGQSVVVLCGPGNNGADGYVTAKILSEHHYPVTVVSFVEPGLLKGAVQQARQHWSYEVLRQLPGELTADVLVVDALFGAGLSRRLDGHAAAWAEQIAALGCHVVAIDIPSGVNGDDGRVDGVAFQADTTITFFRMKPGHLLYPGRARCGQIQVAQIAIDVAVLEKIDVATFENAQPLWADLLPAGDAMQHKYQRGYTLVFSGPAHTTGAARLCARAALRIGAGLVSVACPQDAVMVVASQLTAVMVAPWSSLDDIEQLLSDKRRNVVVLGPGFGHSELLRTLVGRLLAGDAGVLLDADALSVFDDQPERFIEQLKATDAQVVLTPHDGEYNRLFDKKGSRLERARYASELTGATVVLKGPDTVIASADGRSAINCNAPAILATAGSGDVLAGLIAGLMAQGMPTFEAACAAVWLHAECAASFGLGLIAEDIAEQLPVVLSALAVSDQADCSS